MIEACIAGDVEVVKILLQKGNCPAQPDPPFQHTPLRGASVCGQYELISLLLEAGADPNALSDGNRTPLMGCCFLRDTVERNKSEISAKCVKAMLEHERTDPLLKNTFGETALDLARIRGYTESVTLLEDAIKRGEN